MNSRWTDAGAKEAIDRWGQFHGQHFALRVYTARLIGDERTLVLHGGGNVSVKGRTKNILGEELDVVHVKCSGRDMALLEPADLPALQLDNLRRLRPLQQLDDESMVNQIRTNLLDAAAPTPSIETLLHAFLPHRFVDHSHSDALIVLTNQPNGETIIREVLGDRVVIIPYVRPGFDLAKAVAEAVDAKLNAHGAVLMQHDLVTFGDEACESYGRHIEIVSLCEAYISRRVSSQKPRAVDRVSESSATLAARAAPMLRGLLVTKDDPSAGAGTASLQRCILEWRGSNELRQIIGSDRAAEIVSSGPMTADHTIRTKPWWMFVPSPQWSDPNVLRDQFRAEIAKFRGRYRVYAGPIGNELGDFDASPRVILLPGAGFFAAGPTLRDARIAADIAEQTLIAKFDALSIGGFQSLSDADLFDMEFCDMERKKLRRPAGALAGQVVVISGGAGAIGAGIAETCADAGAHVVVTDVDPDRIASVVGRLNGKHGNSCAIGITIDVTNETSVREGFDEIARAFGGADVIVVNAGAAHVAAIDELSVADFRRLLDINAVGSFLFLREGAKLLKRQGTGGNIIVISTKNVAAPGKDFAAYSASKAAAHQLARVAAIELAPFDIRVNLLAPDAVFGDSKAPSGLWAEVGPQRAATHGIDPKTLPHHYRQRSLLRTEVTPRHVGNAVVFFASNATPTTGAVLPIDAGLPDAFPR